MAKYRVINISPDVFTLAVGKGQGLVFPSTRRVIDTTEDLSERRIERLATTGVIVTKTTEAAQNDEPLPRAEQDLIEARLAFQTLFGEDRTKMIDTLAAGKKVKIDAPTSGAVTAAPTTTPPGSTAGGSAGTTTTTRG